MADQKPDIKTKTVEQATPDKAKAAIEAAAKQTVGNSPVAKATAAQAAKVVAPKPAPNLAKRKPRKAAKPPISAKPAQRKPAASQPNATQPIAAKASATSDTPVAANTKETTMNTTDTTQTAYSPAFAGDMTATMTEAMAEIQTRTQETFEKSTALASDATEFAKGNVEAMVESSKVLAEGVQDMGRTISEEAKTAYETATADLREMAAVKSPTELFQLQGRIMRRNFDAMVAASSRSTDAAMKLTGDVFAPLSGRANVAVEKFGKVA